MCSTQEKLQTNLLGISYCLLSLNVTLHLYSIAFDDSKRDEYKIKQNLSKTEQSVMIVFFEALQ